MVNIIEIPTDWTPGGRWPKGISAFEAGALILAVLAYPGAKEKRSRHLFHEAICSRILIECARTDDAFARSSGLSYFLNFEPNRTREQLFKKGMTKIRDAMIAGRMLLPFLTSVWSTQPLLAGDRAPGVNVAAAEAAEVLGGRSGGSAANVISRKWSPNKHVLHIAAALVGVYARMPGAPVNSLSADRQYGQPDWSVPGLAGMPGRLCELIREPELVEGVVRWSYQALEVIRAQKIADADQATVLKLAPVS